VGRGEGREREGTSRDSGFDYWWGRCCKTTLSKLFNVRGTRRKKVKEGAEKFSRPLLTFFCVRC